MTNRLGLQHVRVKFDADHEEADIYKLKDIMYPDDTEVNRFEDLNPGDEVIAKWPMNGKMYSAVVIDPLDNTGTQSHRLIKCGGGLPYLLVLPLQHNTELTLFVCSGA